VDYNIKDVEKTVSELRRQVAEMQRVIDQLQVSEFRYLPAEERYEQRVTKSNSNGQVSHTSWDKVPIVSEPGDVLPDGDATNRYLTWDTVDEEWEAGVLKYPEGDATNKFLIWDAVNSKWIAGDVLPDGSSTNRYLIWDTVTSDWIAGELKYPTGDATNKSLVWNTGLSKWIPGEPPMPELPSGGGSNQYLTKNSGGDVIWDYVRWH